MLMVSTATTVKSATRKKGARNETKREGNQAHHLITRGRHFRKVGRRARRGTRKAHQETKERKGQLMSTINLREVTAELNLRGIPATYEMSGGGCGTIYAGMKGADGFYECAIGPSSFATGEALLEEVCWSRDGEYVAIFTPEKGCGSVRHIVDKIQKDLTFWSF